MHYEQERDSLEPISYRLELFSISIVSVSPLKQILWSVIMIGN
jgi:hypothetical protein